MANPFRRFKSRHYLYISVFSLFLIAVIVWWLPTATIVKFQPVCDFNHGAGQDETENFAYTPNGIFWYGFVSGNLRPEFKEVMSAYFLGNYYRDSMPNDALGYYRVTPEYLYVTIDYYSDPELYHRLTIKAIHTLIRKELWGGENFPVYLPSKSPGVGGWEYWQRAGGGWEPKNFRPGNDLLQELNTDFYDPDGRFRHQYFEANYQKFMGDLEFDERQCEIVQFFSIEGAPPPKNLETALFKHHSTQSQAVNERILQHFVEKFGREKR